MLWAALSAVLLVLAAPPFDAPLLGLVSLVPLFISWQTGSLRSVALRGWLCGVLANLGGQYWAADVMMRFAHLGRASSVVALLLVCVGQGAVFGLWSLGVKALERQRVSVWVAAPLLLPAVEAAVPAIFPWNVGIVAWRLWPLTQVAELGGPAAVSSLVVALNLLAWAAIERARGQSWRSGARPAAGVVGLVVALGLARAAHISSIQGTSEHLSITAVQPNFGILSAEERKQNGEGYIAKLREVTDTAVEAGAQLVVWPESSFPFLFDRQIEREFAVGHPWELRKRRSARLLFGALTHRFGDGVVFNSAVLLSGDGRVAGLFDKRRLFPFGEYIPFAQQFPSWAKSMRADMPDWPEIERGGPRHLLVDGSLKVGALICYEDVFSAPEFADANLLVTVANHTWFGGGAPSLALALATLRAVELRRALVRSTNTGVSSITDALGRVLAVSAPGQAGDAPAVISAAVPLVETASLGPLGVRAFPWGCALVLVALLWRRPSAQAG